MSRLVIGSILGGIVQWIIGALFWATPLAGIAVKSVGTAETADLQTALARTLGPSGTATYFIPSPDTAGGAVLMGKGPVGLIFFNSAGFPAMDWSALLTGLVLSIAMLLLVGVALSLIDGMASRLKALGLIAVATIGYFVLALPVFNFFLPWTWWVYLGVSDAIAFVGGAFVMIRWFMPVRAVAASLD